MKSLKTFATVAILAVMALSLAGCKKDASQQPAGYQTGQESQGIKQLGAVKDDINAINKVHLIVSSQFLAQGNSSAIIEAASKGKPPKIIGGSSDVTAPTISIIYPSNGSAVAGTVGVQVSASDNIGRFSF